MNELSNYFNYYTEIEEHFQRVRGTSLFLLSPLDWALIESWKESGVPLEAVLRGIDSAFEKWRGRKHKTQMVNSLAFCAQAVLTEAQRGPEPAPVTERAPFPEQDVRAYLDRNARLIRATAHPYFVEIAEALELLAGASTESLAHLEDLETRLTVLEERLLAIARSHEPPDRGLEARLDLEAQLRPYRGKMTAPQLALLERQFLDRRCLESASLPRLSLFYLRN